MDINQITGEIVDAAYQVHTGLGPGLLERVYEAALMDMLLQRGLRVERQKPVTFQFNGRTFEEGFTVDLFVEGLVVVELKSAERFSPAHLKQLLTYMKLLGAPLGLLINFGAPTLKEGLKRVINSSAASALPRLCVSPSEPVA
jgi:GxxExxY protein